MITFLQHVANSLLDRYGNNLSEIVVVFPGKRASLFLDQALVDSSSTPVWAPTYRTISELFEEASPYTLCDTVESVCRLYRAYSKYVDDPESLDRFYSWGEILLSDFDDIDKQLVNAKQLFTNIADLRELDDHSYITPEQVEALRSFFGKFSIEENSELKERFLRLWRHLYDIYEELNSSMRAAGLLYEGALQRAVVEFFRGTLAKEHASESDFPFATGKTYVFVGFNVLNEVEQHLFDILQQRGQALFYWDYDTFYLEDHEAGYFLKRNLQRYGNELPTSCFENLSTPKHITFITTSSENAQARYLPQWLLENITEKENQTAVVLCNEQLLQPVLHSIPDASMPLNITMGFPLVDTPVYSFVLALMNLQTDGYDGSANRFRAFSLRTLEAHPYTSLIEEKDWKKGVLDERDLLQYLLNILTMLSPHLHNDIIATEAIFRVYTCVNRLADLGSGPEPLLAVNRQTLVRLLRNVLSSETIPFHGEPAIGLQIMGVLETRALDFTHLLMLSVGEGFLPKKVADSSFIPYTLRESFGLTTLRHKIAVYAYYFYRLIQRAERVTFLYNESNAGIRQNEMSRFLRQLLAETDFPIEFRVLQSSCSPSPINPIVKEKSPELIQRLRNYYDNTGREGERRRFLSPSAMNAYTTCPMKFYYRYVQGMRIDSDASEGLDAILFGEVFHRAAELLYLQITSSGEIVRAQDIDPFLEMEGQRLEPFVSRAFREKFFQDMPEEYRGILFIAKRVVVTYLLQLLRHDRRLTPFRILGLEVLKTKTFHIQDMEIDTGGIIDRLDVVSDSQVDGGYVIRVVDYKTGGRPDGVSTLEQLFKDTDQKAHYYFQALLYGSIISEQESQPVAPCLFYVHKAGSESYDPKLKLGGKIIQDVTQVQTAEGITLVEDYEERLQQLILEIFDPSIPFTQTARRQSCEYCDFRQLCGR